MTSQEEDANLEQQFGPLYPHADYPRGSHIQFRSFDGSIKAGTIIWILEPGRAVRTHQPITAQYVVEPDNPAGTMGFEFVNLGDVQSENE